MRVTTPAFVPALVANLDTRRFLSRTCMKQIQSMVTAAAAGCPDVVDWIDNVLVPYLLSSKFTVRSSIFTVSNHDFLPPELRDDSSAAGYFITLDREEYNLLYGVVDYLSSVTNSCASEDEAKGLHNVTVQNAIAGYRRYVAELKAAIVCETVLDCADGEHRWVSLDSKKSLVVEGYYLHHSGVQHCDELISGRCKFLSLREVEEDKPLLTAVYYANSKQLIGVVGYGNRHPDKQYSENIRELVDKLQLVVE